MLDTNLPVGPPIHLAVDLHQQPLNFQLSFSTSNVACFPLFGQYHTALLRLGSRSSPDFIALLSVMQYCSASLSLLRMRRFYGTLFDKLMCFFLYQIITLPCVNTDNSLIVLHDSDGQLFCIAESTMTRNCMRKSESERHHTTRLMCLQCGLHDIRIGI